MVYRLNMIAMPSRLGILPKLCYDVTLISIIIVTVMFLPCLLVLVKVQMQNLYT